MFAKKLYLNIVRQNCLYNILQFFLVILIANIDIYTRVIYIEREKEITTTTTTTTTVARVIKDTQWKRKKEKEGTNSFS